MCIKHRIMKRFLCALKKRNMLCMPAMLGDGDKLKSRFCALCGEICIGSANGA